MNLVDGGRSAGDMLRIPHAYAPANDAIRPGISATCRTCLGNELVEAHTMDTSRQSTGRKRVAKPKPKASPFRRLRAAVCGCELRRARRRAGVDVIAPGPVESNLRKALSVYKEHGGAVGAYTDEKGRCCAVGALGVAVGERPQMVLGTGYEFHLLYEALLTMRAKAPGYPNGCTWVPVFNDAYPGLPVRNLFRRAIRLAQERGL